MKNLTEIRRDTFQAEPKLTFKLYRSAIARRQNQLNRDFVQPTGNFVSTLHIINIPKCALVAKPLTLLFAKYVKPDFMQDNK